MLSYFYLTNRRRLCIELFPTRTMTSCLDIRPYRQPHYGNYDFARWRTALIPNCQTRNDRREWDRPQNFRQHKMFTRCLSCLRARCSTGYPTKIFKVNISETRKRLELCSKLTITTSQRHQWRFGVFIINSERTFTPVYKVSIVDFEQLNVCWVTNSMGTCTRQSPKHVKPTISTLKCGWSKLTYAVRIPSKNFMKSFV